MTSVIPAPFACLPTGEAGEGQPVSGTSYTLSITQDRITEEFTVVSGTPTNPPAISKSLASVINNNQIEISVLAERVGGTVKITSLREGSFVTVSSSTNNFEFIYDESSYEKILAQFQDKENIRDLLGVFTDQQEELEAALFELLQLRTIPLAPASEPLTSRVLEIYGEILNLRRSGLTNTRYREALQQKIVRNSSEGTAEDVIGAATYFLGWGELSNLHPEFKVVLEETYPAGLDLTVIDGNWTSNIGADTAIKNTVAAGIQFQLINQPLDAFGFDSYNPAGTGTVNPNISGFGSAYQIPQVDGGYYATLA